MVSFGLSMPLIELNHALSFLSNKGLRSDKIHLNAYREGCSLGSKGLRFGQNLRNALTLKMLHALNGSFTLKKKGPSSSKIQKNSNLNFF